MTAIKEEDLKKDLPSESDEQKKVGDENEAKGLHRDGTPKQDPLKTEFERVQKKEGGRTKREKLIFTKKRIEDQLSDLDEEEGIVPGIEEQDETPVTVGMLKERDKKNTVKTALDLADEIENESERALTRYHISNSIRSTGNPKEDLRLARALVNDVKNREIIETLQKKPTAKGHSSGGGSPLRVEEEQELTPEEESFMKPPFNLSKDQILKSREGK